MSIETNCLVCQYQTVSKKDFNTHFTRSPHKEIISNLRAKNNDLKVCEYCGSVFKHSNNFYRHRKSRCMAKFGFNESKPGISKTDAMKIVKLEHENEKLKLEMKYKEKLAKEKEKNNLTKVEYQKQMIENLQYQANSNVNSPGLTVNCQQNNIANLISGNKGENLNRYLNEVLDLDTFTENYQTQFPLSYDETKVLLENYQMSGIKSYVPGFFSYLQNNYSTQIKEITGDENESVLPFVMSDASLRTHFEKTKVGWKKSSNLDKIKKLIIISNDQIYKHHSEIIPMSAYERQVIANALLRKSSYHEAEKIMKNKIESTPLALESDDKATDQKVKVKIKLAEIKETE